MMDKELFFIPVTGEGEDTPPADAGASETPGTTEEVVTQTPPADAETESAKKLAEIESKHQAEIRKLQSTYDRNAAIAQQKAAQEKAELESRLQEIEMRGLDEEDRKKYIEEHKDAASNKILERNRQLELQVQDNAQKGTYLQYFRDEIGLDPTKLVIDKGSAELVESGWQQVKELLKRAKELEKKYGEAETQKLKKKDEAPDVLTGTKGVPGNGITWAALEKKYGTREAAYEAFEQGLIKELPKS